jgi:hypothetical protein
MYPLVSLQALLFGGGSLVVSLLAGWRGNRVARFYALAWLSFWILFVAGPHRLLPLRIHPASLRPGDGG